MALLKRFKMQCALPRLLSLLLLLLLLLLSCRPLHTAASLSLLSDGGFPLLFIQRSPTPPVLGGNTSSTPTSTAPTSFAYVPAHMGPSVGVLHAYEGVMGLSAEAIVPYTASPSSSANAQGCAAEWAAPAGWSGAGNSTTVPAYYSGKIVLLQRGDACTDHVRVVAAQRAGAALVLLLGGEAGWSELVRSDSAEGVPIGIPVLSLSGGAASSAALVDALRAASALSPLRLFVPGGGAIDQAEWDSLRALASSIRFPARTDAAASGTRPLSELLPFTQTSVAQQDGGTVLLTSANSAYGLDPCMVRVRGVWCVDGHVVAFSAPGIVDAAASSSSSFVNELPAEALAGLQWLLALDLSNNVLRGPVPPVLLGGLSLLSHLDLSRQPLLGSLVAFATSAEGASANDAKGNGTAAATATATGSLRSLNLSHTSLRGPLSPELVSALAPGLVLLDLSDTSLSGELPLGMGRLSGLQTLGLDRTEMGGELPGEVFSQLVSLRVFTAAGASFRGSIPPALGRVSPDLAVVDLSSNMLSGPIPTGLYDLRALRSLRLGGNALTGTISPLAGGWLALQELGLENNALSGGLPEQLGLLSNLAVLRLRGNGFSGRLPRGLAALARLRELSAEANRFDGGVGDGDVAGEGEGDRPFEGPDALNPASHWPSLRSLHLGHCGLRGMLPAVAGMHALEELGLEGNAFSGALLHPAHFDALPSLTTLSLAGSSLSLGALPNLAGSESVLAMDLSHNDLSLVGQMGPQWNLPRLRSMRVVGAGLRLDLGDTLASLGRAAPALEVLDLSWNALSGTLSGAALRGLPRLSHLLLGHNALTALGPRLLSRLPPRLEALDLSSNALLTAGGGELFASSTVPALPPGLASIALHNNTLLRGGSLPGWVLPSTDGAMSRPSPDALVTCPSSFALWTGVGVGARAVSLTLDPAFYAHALCACEPGHFGSPPHCAPLAPRLDLTSSLAPGGAVLPGLVVAWFDGRELDSSWSSRSAKDAVLVGSLRVDSGQALAAAGFDQTYLLGPRNSTSSSGSSSGVSSPALMRSRDGAGVLVPVRAVHVLLEIDAASFALAPGVSLALYAGSSADMDAAEPVYEFHGGIGVAALTAGANNTITARVAVAAGRAALSLRWGRSSSAPSSPSASPPSAPRFTATWSVSPSCPGGYSLVSEVYWRGGGLGPDHTPGSGVCAEVHAPDENMLFALYALTAAVIACHVVVLVAFLARRHLALKCVPVLPNGDDAAGAPADAVAAAPSPSQQPHPLSLCLLLLFFNTLLSISSLWFARRPDPFSPGLVSSDRWAGILKGEALAQWQCRTRPWPVGIAIAGVLATLCATVSVRSAKDKLPAPQAKNDKDNEEDDEQLEEQLEDGQAAAPVAHADDAPAAKPSPSLSAASKLTIAVALVTQLCMLVLYTALPLSALELSGPDSSRGGRFVYQCTSLYGDGGAGSPLDRGYVAWLAVHGALLLAGAAMALRSTCRRRSSSGIPIQNGNGLLAVPDQPAEPSATLTRVGIVALFLVVALVAGLDFALDAAGGAHPDLLACIRAGGANAAALLLLATVVVPRCFGAASGGGGGGKIGPVEAEAEAEDLAQKEDAAIQAWVPLPSAPRSGVKPKLKAKALGAHGRSASLGLPPPPPPPPPPSAAAAAAAAGADGAAPLRQRKLLSSVAGVVPRRKILALATPSSSSKAAGASGGVNRALFSPSAAGAGSVRSSPSGLLAGGRVTIGAAAAAATAAVSAAAPASPSVPSSPSLSSRHRASLSMPGLPSIPSSAARSPAQKRIDSSVALLGAQLCSDVEYTSRNEHSLAERFAKWRFRYDTELTAFLACELAHLEACYSQLLVARTHEVLSLRARVDADAAAMRGFDAWVAGLVEAVPRGEGQRAKVQLFQSLRPPPELMRPLGPPQALEPPRAVSAAATQAALAEFRATIPGPDLTLAPLFASISPGAPVPAAGGSVVKRAPRTPQTSGSCPGAQGGAGFSVHTPPSARMRPVHPSSGSLAAQVQPQSNTPSPGALVLPSPALVLPSQQQHQQLQPLGGGGSLALPSSSKSLFVNRTPPRLSNKQRDQLQQQQQQQQQPMRKSGVFHHARQLAGGAVGAEDGGSDSDDASVAPLTPGHRPQQHRRGVSTASIVLSQQMQQRQLLGKASLGIGSGHNRSSSSPLGGGLAPRALPFSMSSGGSPLRAQTLRTYHSHVGGASPVFLSPVFVTNTSLPSQPNSGTVSPMAGYDSSCPSPGAPSSAAAAIPSWAGSAAHAASASCGSPSGYGYGHGNRAVSAMSSPALKRHKLIAERDERTGRGEVGVFLVDGLSKKEQLQQQQEKQRLRLPNAKASIADEEAISSLTKAGFICQSNPLVSAPASPPSPKTAAARRASLQRASALRRRMGVEGPDGDGTDGDSDSEAVLHHNPLVGQPVTAASVVSAQASHARQASVARGALLRTKLGLDGPSSDEEDEEEKGQEEKEEKKREENLGAKSIYPSDVDPPLLSTVQAQRSSPVPSPSGNRRPVPPTILVTLEAMSPAHDADSVAFAATASATVSAESTPVDQAQQQRRTQSAATDIKFVLPAPALVLDAATLTALSQPAKAAHPSHPFPSFKPAGCPSGEDALVAGSALTQSLVGCAPASVADVVWEKEQRENVLVHQLRQLQLQAMSLPISTPISTFSQDSYSLGGGSSSSSSYSSSGSDSDFASFGSSSTGTTLRLSAPPAGSAATASSPVDTAHVTLSVLDDHSGAADDADADIHFAPGNWTMRGVHTITPDKTHPSAPVSGAGAGQGAATQHDLGASPSSLVATALTPVVHAASSAAAEEAKQPEEEEEVVLLPRRRPLQIHPVRSAAVSATAPLQPRALFAAFQPVMPSGEKPASVGRSRAKFGSATKALSASAPLAGVDSTFAPV